jgi:L-threonylcarbamoyladenylate synthase
MRTKILKISPKRPQSSKIILAASLIRQGRLVAFPTETVYGLGANALNPSAVKKIFEAKGRPADNPLIVHIYDEGDLKLLATDIPEITKKITGRFWPGPITIVLKKSRLVPKITTAGLDTVAVRMPRNKIAQLLIKEAGVPIAAPSANFAGRPSPTLAKHVLEDLGGRIDMILDGGQTNIGIESTVIDLSGKRPMLLRPGGITLEELQKVIGSIVLHPLLRGRKSKAISRSPGMKYRHYSPAAKLVLIEGSKHNVNKKISELIKTYKKQQKRVGVMTTDKVFSQKADMVKYVGSNFGEIAANLFKALREFDSKKIDIILAQGISKKGLGLGIMNRLGKAAYKKIVI